MPWPKVVYEDIAPGAAQATSVSAGDRQPWCDPSQALEAHAAPKAATLEHNFWLLDEGFQFFPDTPADHAFGWWTQSMSDADGRFQVRPVLELQLSGLYTSVGLTFFFDSIGPTWPTWMNVKWYRGGELLADMDFHPDGCQYSAIHPVKRFDRLVVTFDGMSQGYRYLKLERSVYGIVRTFGTDEVSDIAIYDSTSLISDGLEAGDATFSVRNLSTIPFNFLRKQTLYFYHGEDLLAVRFITGSTQLTGRHYTVAAQGFLGLLAEGEEHYGGMYDGAMSEDVLADILGDIVPYTLEPELKGIPIKGWLPRDSRLNNLARVLFAIGGCASSARSTALRLFKPDLPGGSAEPASLAGRSRQYPKLTTDKAVTAVEVTEHTFTAGTGSTELFNSPLNGATTVTFPEPMSQLAITGGTILGSGANYAVISGTGGTVKLTGTGYRHTTRTLTKTNGLVEGNTFPNVKKCYDNYLVSPANSQAVLDRYLRFWQRSAYVTTSIDVGADGVGDLVRLENSFHGPRLGNIVSMDVSLSKKLVAEVKVILAPDDE